MSNRCKLGSFVESWIAQSVDSGAGRQTYTPVFLNIMNALWLSMKSHDGHEVNHKDFFDTNPRTFLLAHLEEDGFHYSDGKLWAEPVPMGDGTSDGWWQEICFEGNTFETLLTWLTNENSETCLEVHYIWRSDAPQIEFQ